MKQAGKQAFTPKLRFPEFRNKGEWSQAKVQDIIGTITPPKKLATSDYLAKGMFPIIDQSQSHVCGWTNDDEAVISSPLPAIVFGDHTCVLKLVEHPFAQGADGIKIIAAKYGITTEFLYHALNYRPLVMEDYKRHFSILKVRPIAFPDLNCGEQQKIADCLTSLDDLIVAHGRKLAALRDHKKGLMQQLFPREGETQPRLRFPEFRGKGAWEKRKLADIAVIAKGKGIAKANVVENGQLPCVRYGELYTHYGEVIHNVVSATNIPASQLVLSQPGDVIVPASGETKDDIATAACVVQGGVALGSDLNIIRSDINGRYFSYYLNGAKRREIAKIAQGDTVAHLYPGQLSKIFICYPAASEQHRIASCLSALDDQIAAQAAKIDALKQHKKGLMQQLFPSPEEAV